MANNPSPLRIAIIGGGLAGATLANALIQHPHLDVQVYESAPSFSERGAAIALGSNAQQALEKILPAGKGDLFKQAGAVPINSSRSIIGSGPHAGEIIMDLEGEDPGIIVHRASLLRELVSPLPQSALHTNKKLVSINIRSQTDNAPATNKALEVVFEDGNVEQADVVIGADGIFGLVRSHVLRGEADTHPASAAGFWDSRVLIPMEKARELFGETSFDVNRQNAWVGDGAFLMLDAVENGTVLQCITSAIEKPSLEQNRKHEVTVDTLTQTLGGWENNPIAKGMIKLCREQGTFDGYSQWEHKSTPTYASGHVCVLGDAAHATTPWQGSGAAMAFEDVMILQELLGSVTSPQDIPAALKAYDILRRSRCQQIIESSREVGTILCGQHGLVPGELRELLAHKWDFIFALNMDDHKEEALRKFREIRQG